MGKVLWYTGIGLLVIAGLAVQFLVSRRRHGRDYRGQLEPILAEYGLTFVSARGPGFFKVMHDHGDLDELVQHPETHKLLHSVLDHMAASGSLLAGRYKKRLTG